MKKFLWVLGGLFLVLLIAMISIPLFVDVDQYRPTIVAEANKRINGKLELGHLKLNLWGAIKIQADSIVVRVNGFSEPMLDTKQFHLEIPFLSVLSGKPQIVAVLDAPKITLRKEVNGKMNLMELMKTAEAESAPSNVAIRDQLASVSGAPKTKSEAKSEPAKAPPAPAAAIVPAAAPIVAAPAAAAPAGPTKVPALVAGARIGLTIRKGEVHYLDKLAKSEYHVNGLDLDARNLGLGSTMDISLTAPLKGSMPDIAFEGPITLETELTPVLVNNEVRSVRGKLAADATKLAVEMKGGMFKKSPSMTLTLRAEVDGNDKETLIKTFDLNFHHYKLHGKGRATMEPVAAQLEITSDPLKLDEVQEFVPMVAAYQLKGLLNFASHAEYGPNVLKANGDLSVKDGSFFMKEFLKAPMEFQVQAGFTESTLNLVRASLSAPDTELQLVGDVKNFLAPQFSFALSGKSFNVDKTIVIPASAPAKQALLTLVNSAYAAPPPADVNPILEMAKNPIVAKASGTLNGQVGRITAYGANFEQAVVKSRLQNLVLYVTEASFKTFGGTVKANAETDLKAPALTYKTAGNIAGVSAKEAFKSYFPKYQNTLDGTVDGNWNLSGAAYPAAIRMRSIKGTAKMVAKDGTLKSVDVQESINAAMGKIPFLKDKKAPTLDDGFRTLTADIRFENGNIHAEPVEMQPRNKGFVIKGKSTIAESLEQDTYLDIYDPQGILPKEIQAGAGKPAIPLHVTGPITSPKTDYGYTVQRMAGSAGKNLAKDAIGKFLGGDKKPGEGGKQDALKDAADKLKKKFKFF